MNINILKNIGWRFAETIGAQMVSFIVSIILARLLSPQDYGIIAIIIIFINIANIFAESGYGTALIQRKVYDNKDFSTIFYFNIIFSLIVYFILFFISPVIAKFYNKSQITILIRVLGIRVIFSSLNSVQKAYVSKTMQFKKFFFSTLIGTFISGVIGVIMAFLGFGVWALVFQYLSNVIIDTIVLWFTVKWRPILYFSFKCFKELFNYGSKILLTSLVNEIYIQTKGFLIGTVYSSTELAYFNRGQQLPATISTGLNNAVNSVMFPLMSSVQDDFVQLKKILSTTIQTLAFFVIQLLSFLIAVFPTLIPFLMTSKWNMAIPYLQFASFNNMVVIIQSSYMEAFKSLGKTNIYMKISWIQKILGVTLMYMFLYKGPISIIIIEIIVNSIILFLTMLNIRKYLDYKILDQINLFLPNILSSAVIVIVLYPINFLSINMFMILIVQFIIFIGIVLFIGRLLKNEVLTKGIRKIKSEYKKNKKVY